MEWIVVVNKKNSDICNAVDSFQKSLILRNHQQCMRIRNIVFTAKHYIISVGIFRHHSHSSHTYMYTQWVAHSHAHMEYEILDGKYANVCECESHIRTLWADEREGDNTSVSRARTNFSFFHICYLSGFVCRVRIFAIFCCYCKSMSAVAVHGFYAEIVRTQFSSHLFSAKTSLLYSILACMQIAFNETTKNLKIQFDFC